MTDLDRAHLLSDVEVARFVVNGYHMITPELPEGLNESIATQLDVLESNPGDAITEAVPELWQILEHPAARGVLVSLLGPDYEVQSHRHWHCKQAGSAFMQWHQDSVNNRDLRLNRFLGLYYPRDVTTDMGPTVIVPGTQYRNAPTDRMATYTNIRGQVPLVVEAGTMAFTHYDLWHGAVANRSDQKRHMIKFLFRRTEDNTEPTWNHDPAAVEEERDWNLRGQAEDVTNILGFTNPIMVAQSDHYKESRIRRQVWQYLLGKPDAIPA
ncbi:MAG: phytanoyl-CoA dioxygenase family protein [Candidatus Latescibacterota bacterium]|nr:phytanoyl-CoA dioxygenase family protein [Candidatus Latescibacterota bacterium]